VKLITVARGAAVAIKVQAVMMSHLGHLASPLKVRAFLKSTSW